VREAVHRLRFHRAVIEVTVWALAVMLISIIINISLSRVLARIARKYHSQALEADALHFQTDVWSSAVVIVGLVAVKTGLWCGDAVAGFGRLRGGGVGQRTARPADRGRVAVFRCFVSRWSSERVAPCGS